MKKQFMLLVSMLLAAFSSVAQTSKETFMYYNRDVVSVRKYDRSIPAICSDVATNNFEVYRGLRFFVVSPEYSDAAFGKYYVIQFDGSVTKGVSSLYAINATNSKITDYYCIRSSDLTDEDKVVKRYSTKPKFSSKLVVGQLTIPFKIRPKVGKEPSRIDGDFTIGGSVGWGFRMSHFKNYYLNLSLAGGPGMVKLDSALTNGYLKESADCFSLAGGGAITFDFDGFQVGLVAGWDYVGGHSGENWIYNKNLWYSFGIGYQFLKPKDDTKK